MILRTRIGGFKWISVIPTVNQNQTLKYELIMD
jgi:hypothetical protein